MTATATPSEQTFSPSRLVWARRRRGMAIARLASRVGVERHAIAGYEAGEFAPRPDRFRAIAQQLEFPTRFFFGQDIGEVLPERVSFRSRSTMAASARDRALGSAALAISISQWIAARYALPELNLTDGRSVSDATTAAHAVRRRWDLGTAPIENIIDLLEGNGVRLYSLPADAAAAGPFSFWHNERPYMLLDMRKPGDEILLDAARELGHLLLHRRISPAGRRVQQEASDFARAFLMPVTAPHAETNGVLSNDRIAIDGRRWGMPLTVCARRLHELGEISDWQFRHLATAGANDAGSGYNMRLVPAILGAVFAALRARGISRRTLARELHIYLEDVDGLVFGQATAQLHDEVSSEHRPVRLRPRLAIVKP